MPSCSPAVWRTPTTSLRDCVSACRSLPPIHIYPGENELEALAENALAVLRGEREVRTYV